MCSTTIDLNLSYTYFNNLTKYNILIEFNVVFIGPLVLISWELNHKMNFRQNND